MQRNNNFIIFVGLNTKQHSQLNNKTYEKNSINSNNGITPYGMC